jgi:hypothetical protein
MRLLQPANPPPARVRQDSGRLCPILPPPLQWSIRGHPFLI